MVYLSPAEKSQCQDVERSGILHDALFDALRNFIDMVCLEVGSPTVQYAERKIGDSRTNMIVGRN